MTARSCRELQRLRRILAPRLLLPDPALAPAPMPDRKPDPSQLRRAQAELEKCLPILIDRFPDPEFKETSPKLRLEVYAPLPEQSVRPCGHLVTLYTTRDLCRPVEEVLAIVLHKAVHLANAFRWKEDCNWRSRHNRRFRALAEEVGFDVDWVNSRYGWARTTPTPSLQRLLRELRFDETVLEPFQRGGAISMNWHCGQFCFPEPEEVKTLLGRPDPPPHLRRLAQVRGLTVNRVWPCGATAPAPMLRITGKWLAELGFTQACRVRIDACYGELRIRSRDPWWHDPRRQPQPPTCGRT